RTPRRRPDHSCRGEDREIDGGERAGKLAHIGSELGHEGLALEIALVHIERAANLDLETMAARPGFAVMRRGETAGIGCVARHGVAPGGEVSMRRLHDERVARDAVAVAEHDVGAAAARRALAVTDARGHRVAVDEEIAAEALARRAEKLAE